MYDIYFNLTVEEIHIYYTDIVLGQKLKQYRG